MAEILLCTICVHIPRGIFAVKIAEIRTIARALDIKTGKLRKNELIQAIQNHEGNFPCFGSAIDGVCDQYGCLWRLDCLKS